MRTKTRTTAEIKPGMVIRLDFSQGKFRQVAAVERGPWPNTRSITFTDGTGDWHHCSTEWHAAKGKTVRKVAICRPGVRPIDVTACMFFAYATA